MTPKAFQIRSNGNILLPNTASSLDLITASLPPGFYTTFSTLAQGTRVLGLRAHLERLYLPAKGLGLKPSVDEEVLRKRIAELARENLPHESRIRLILTKELGEVFVVFQLFTPLSREIYKNGVRVVTSTVERSDPRIKGTDFIAQSAAQRKLVGRDIFEVLLTHNGNILEGMTSNFYGIKYAVVNREAKQPPTGQGLLRISGLDTSEKNARSTRPAGKLITAQKGILLGVTRRAVLRLARGQGMSIEYRPPRMDEKLDEAFLTSSSRGVVPIVSIDNLPVGEGSAGAWTKAISQAYQAYVEERSEEIVQ